MIKCDIYNLKDGEHPVEIIADVTDVQDIFPEFIGKILITGTIRKFNKRYTLNVKIECNTCLICDRSLKEFNQLITAELVLNFLADSYLYKLTRDNDSYENDNIVISEDDRYLEISEYVREELSLSLPMKRVSPEYADKMIDEIYPEYSAKVSEEKEEEPEISDYWTSLKNLRIN